MDSLLDEIFDDLKTSFDKKFSDHFCRVKNTETRKSLYVLIKKKRGKILGDNRKDLIRTVEYIAQKVYNKYAKNFSNIRDSYFLYCKPIKN